MWDSGHLRSLSVVVLPGARRIDAKVAATPGLRDD